MQLVITPDESGRLDAASVEPVEVLMERAGLGVALAAVRMGIGYGSRVVVLAGAGNNGGDGYVAARYLTQRGAQVRVHALGYPRGDFSPARLASIRAVAAGVDVVDFGKPEPADLIIDALFGVGFRGALPVEVAPWLEHPAPVLAVDVPSGLQAGTGEVPGQAFAADVTVTFHALKPGHLIGAGPEHCGLVETVDIGLIGGEPELRLCEVSDAPIPARSRTAHKWSVGSVAVVGSARGMVGAGVLAARSSLYAGAGSASLISPRAMQAQAAAMSAGLLTHGVGEGDTFSVDDAAAVLEYGERFDVMVLGPGLGIVPEFVHAVVAGRTGKLLIDADGLNSLGGLEPLAGRDAPTLITPHAGEYRRLTGEEAGYVSARAIPEKARTVVLLKGNPTFVLGAEQWAITSGGPELATIGTGDVLSGVVAAFWAQGLDGETAARSGAFWHGIAGSKLAALRTVTAEELVYAVGELL